MPSKPFLTVRNAGPIPDGTQCHTFEIHRSLACSPTTPLGGILRSLSACVPENNTQIEDIQGLPRCEGSRPDAEVHVRGAEAAEKSVGMAASEQELPFA